LHNYCIYLFLIFNKKESLDALVLKVLHLLNTSQQVAVRREAMQCLTNSLLLHFELVADKFKEMIDTALRIAQSKDENEQVAFYAISFFNTLVETEVSVVRVFCIVVT